MIGISSVFAFGYRLDLLDMRTYDMGSIVFLALLLVFGYLRMVL